MKTFKSLLVIGLILSLASFKSGEKIRLQLHLQKGETYKYLMKMDMKMHAAKDEKEIKANVELELGAHVDDVDAQGRYALSYTIGNIKVDAQMDEAHKFSIDTHDASDPKVEKIKAVLKKIIISAVITPSGKMASVDVDRFFDSIGAMVGKNSAEIDKVKFKMDSTMKSPKVQEAMNRNGFPERDLSEGDSWSPELGDNPFFKTKPEINFTLKEITDSKVKIGVVEKIVIDKDTTLGSQSFNMKMKMNLTGTQTLNRQTCMPADMEGSGDMTADFGGSGKGPGEMNIKVSFRMTRME